MWRLTRRAALMGAGAYLGYSAALRWAQELPSTDGTSALAEAPGDIVLNDASGLSATPVHRHVIVQDNTEDALLAQLRGELDAARADGRPVALGAARHTMGAQAIARNGHAITFESGLVEVDTSSRTYRCRVGARWSDVLTVLDPMGLSPAIMQTNTEFGVAASFAVNAHGWAAPFGPVGSSVRSFRLLLPSGEVLTCGRFQNVDLFKMTMGGYGLTGAVLDIDLQAVPNQRLSPSFTKLRAEDVAPALRAASRDPEVALAGGHLSLARAEFLSDALLVQYRASGDQDNLPRLGQSDARGPMAEALLRAQLGRETMKRWRWWAQTDFAPRFAGETTRNTLLNAPMADRAGTDPDRSDIWHGYFVPPARFADFLAACRDVIPASYQSLLDVSLRFVEADRESLLSYAGTPRIAAMMQFSQEKTRRAEADMRRMTQALIARVTALGGTYYLPFRPHATQGQFVRAYRRGGAFAQQKRNLDADLLFRNALWDNYLAAL